MARTSYSEYCGSRGHAEGGHRILHTDHILGPTRVRLCSLDPESHRSEPCHQRGFPLLLHMLLQN